jgi:hypothetical protein
MLGAEAPCDVNTEAPASLGAARLREHGVTPEMVRAGARRLQELAEIGTSWAEIVARDVYLTMRECAPEAREQARQLELGAASIPL